MRCRFYLPPIILFAGLSVRKKAFFKQLPTIASLGIVGTYIAFAVIAVLTYAVSKVFAGITLAVSLRGPCASRFTTYECVSSSPCHRQNCRWCCFTMHGKVCISWSCRAQPLTVQWRPGRSAWCTQLVNTAVLKKAALS